MRAIGNCLWFVLGGALMGLAWWLVGLVVRTRVQLDQALSACNLHLADDAIARIEPAVPAGSVAGTRCAPAAMGSSKANGQLRACNVGRSARLARLSCDSIWRLTRET